MKKTNSLSFIFSFLFLFLFSAARCQDKLRFHAVGFGVGVSNEPIKRTETNIAFNLDASYRYKQNLFSVEAEHSSSLKLLSNISYATTQLNLLYGREFSSSGKITTEAFVGIGLFNFRYRDNETNFEYIKGNTIGFPLRIKLLYNFGKIAAFVINPNININSINTYYSILLQLVIRFGKK